MREVAPCMRMERWNRNHTPGKPADPAMRSRGRSCIPSESMVFTSTRAERAASERGRGEIRFERRCQSQRREAAKLFRCHGCGGRRGRGKGGGGGQIFFPLQGSGCPSPSSYLSVPSSSSSSPTSIPFLRAGCEISRNQVLVYDGNPATLSTNQDLVYVRISILDQSCEAEVPPNLPRAPSVHPEHRGRAGERRVGALRVAYRRRLVTHFHAFLRHFLSYSLPPYLLLRELQRRLRALNADRLSGVSAKQREWTRTRHSNSR